MLEAISITPQVSSSEIKKIKSIEESFRKHGEVGIILFNSFKKLKGNYSKNLNTVPLFFIWSTFRDHYSSYGDLMMFCYRWDIFTIGDLKKLTKAEFKLLWIRANLNDDFYIEETVELISKTLRCFEFRFKGDKR